MKRLSSLSLIFLVACQGSETAGGPTPTASPNPTPVGPIDVCTHHYPANEDFGVHLDAFDFDEHRQFEKATKANATYPAWRLLEQSVQQARELAIDTWMYANDCNTDKLKDSSCEHIWTQGDQWWHLTLAARQADQLTVEVHSGPDSIGPWSLQRRYQVEGFKWRQGTLEVFEGQTQPLWQLEWHAQSGQEWMQLSGAGEQLSLTERPDCSGEIRHQTETMNLVLNFSGYAESGLASVEHDGYVDHIGW